MPGRGIGVHEGLGVTVLPRAPPSMTYEANVNGAPQSRSAAPDRRGGYTPSARSRGRSRAMPPPARVRGIDVGTGPHRAVDDRAVPFANSSPPHRLEHQEDVREEDRGIDRKALDRHQRHLGGERRRLAELEEAVVGPQRPVLGRYRPAWRMIQTGVQSVARGGRHREIEWRRTPDEDNARPTDVVEGQPRLSVSKAGAARNVSPTNSPILGCVGSRSTGRPASRSAALQTGPIDPTTVRASAGASRCCAPPSVATCSTCVTWVALVKRATSSRPPTPDEWLRGGVRGLRATPPIDGTVVTTAPARAVRRRGPGSRCRTPARPRASQRSRARYRAPRATHARCWAPAP